MGAWIEIPNFAIDILLRFVAPLVGAWIEIFNSGYDIVPIIVAPLVGAWIEIHLLQYIHLTRTRSLPSWERGLKFPS